MPHSRGGGRYEVLVAADDAVDGLVAAETRLDSLKGPFEGRADIPQGLFRFGPIKLGLEHVCAVYLGQVFLNSLTAPFRSWPVSVRESPDYVVEVVHRNAPRAT